MIAGFQGQPAMAGSGFDYDLAPEVLNLLVLVGGAALALTVVGVIALAVTSLVGEPTAGRPWPRRPDPRMGHDLAAPADNFAEVPRVASAEPLFDLKPGRSDA
ncbi:MAG: hypothetical protein R2705_23260 [Ilumatobacteraceae bacterium]